MKKILLMLMVFLFVGLVTVSATTIPTDEKQVMVFVEDVGIFPASIGNEIKVPIDSNIDKIKCAVSESLIFRKIVYESTMINGSFVSQKDAKTAGDGRPII